MGSRERSLLCLPSRFSWEDGEERRNIMPPFSFTYNQKFEKQRWRPVPCGNRDFGAPPPVTRFSYPEHTPEPPRHQRLACIAQFRVGDRVVLSNDCSDRMLVDIVRAELADKALPPYPMGDAPEVVYLIKKHIFDYSPAGESLRSESMRWVHGSHLRPCAKGERRMLRHGPGWSQIWLENITFDDAKRVALNEKARTDRVQAKENADIQNVREQEESRAAAHRACQSRSVKFALDTVSPAPAEHS